MIQKEFFNSVAENWDAMCYHDTNKIENILDMAQIKEGSQVLDVGTGTGIIIPELSKRVSNKGFIKGIDVAEKMIEVAKKKNKFDNVIFECKDALKLDNDNKYYDCIVCYSMFPHFESKEKAISILSKKLNKEGKLIICHSQSRDAINKLHSKANQVVKEDRLPTMNQLKLLFVKNGLNILKEVDNEEMFVIIGSIN